MEKFYKISIPKPCHENWNLMTPSEKGRFCDSCSKTVIDFTQMSSKKVQEFIHENQNTKMCGHFKRSQLDTIHISIPIEIIKTEHSLKRSLLLALLITMGTTLISCTNHDGKKQKIESVEIIENPKLEECPTTLTNTNINKCAQTKVVSNGKNKIKNHTDVFYTTGEIIPPKKESDTIIPLVVEEEIEGDIDIDVTMGFVIQEEVTDFNNPVPAYLLEAYPAFDKTPKEERTRETFSEQIKEFVTKNYNTNTCINIGLKGVQRIYTQFEIDKEGKIKDIKVRAAHPSLEKEAEKMIQKIPQLIPGTYKNEAVRTIYSLPIVFKMEE